MAEIIERFVVPDLASVKPMTGATHLSWDSPWDAIRTADGRVYTRPQNQPGGPNDRPMTFDAVGPSAPAPAVICECGGEAFRIRYGDYECIGVCVDCGTEYTLYDG